MFGQLFVQTLSSRSKAMKTDMNGKIVSYTKFCAQNRTLASEMQNLKQPKTSVFPPLILKRWIDKSSQASTRQLEQHFYSFIKGRQEELLNQAEAVSPEETTNKSKIKTLQDLFRPPVDIIFKGTFEAVCIVF